MLDVSLLLKYRNSRLVCITAETYACDHIITYSSSPRGLTVTEVLAYMCLRVRDYKKVWGLLLSPGILSISRKHASRMLTTNLLINSCQRSSNMHLFVPLSCVFGQVQCFEPTVADWGTNTFLYKQQTSGY